MEATRIVGGIVFVAAFFAAGSLVAWFMHNAARNQYGAEAAMASGAESTQLQRLIRNGFRALAPASNALMRIPNVKTFIQRIAKTLGERGIDTCDRSLASLLLGCLCALFIVGLAISGSAVFAITAVIVSIILVNTWVAKQQELRRSRLREELPNAIQAMNACFCVGYSLPQIFEQVALDLEGPLKAVFQRTAAVINAGGTVEEALEVLKHQTSEPELFFLATALEIQHRTGSSLSQVLDVVHQSVDDQLELKRLLQTQTAQAKLSAQIVTIMPFLIIGIFSLVSKGFLEPFFTSTFGIILLAIAIAMQVFGIMLVRKLLKVEVV